MKTIEEIEKQIEKAVSSDQNLSGMTYQQGVEYALSWVIGEMEEEPIK